MFDVLKVKCSLQRKKDKPTLQKVKCVNVTSDTLRQIRSKNPTGFLTLDLL